MKKPKKPLLSDKQVFVLQSLAHGLNIDDIAQEMQISRRMVDVHIHAIKAALKANTREQSVAIGIKKKIIKP